MQEKGTLSHNCVNFVFSTPPLHRAYPGLDASQKTAGVHEDSRYLRNNKCATGPVNSIERSTTVTCNAVGTVSYWCNATFSALNTSCQEEDTFTFPAQHSGYERRKGKQRLALQPNTASTTDQTPCSSVLCIPDSEIAVAT